MITIVMNNPAPVQRGERRAAMPANGGSRVRVQHAHFEGKGSGEPREGDGRRGKVVSRARARGGRRRLAGGGSGPDPRRGLQPFQVEGRTRGASAAAGAA